MNLTVGNKVVYPHQGPCVVDRIVDRIINGRSMSFYDLALLDGRGGRLLVPTEKIGAQGIRHLVASSEIPKLLGHLKKAGVLDTNWKQRAIEMSKLLDSGSAFDLAEVVDSLTELNEARALSPRERQTLDRARKLLICEISEVTGVTKSAAEEMLDEALKSRKRH